MILVRRYTTASLLVVSLVGLLMPVSVAMAVTSSRYATSRYTAAAARPATAAKAAPAPAPNPGINKPGTGEGLEISPPVVQITGNPGQTITTSIRLRNVTAQNLYAIPQTDDFGAKGEDGEPQVLLNETEATRFSLKYWIQPLSTLLLVPQEIKTELVTIKIPANGEPGGHYGVVRFTAVPAGSATNGVALSASIGALLLLKVNGPITENLGVTQFYVSQNEAGKPAGFFQNGPLSFTERIQNNGDIHEQPTGSVVVYDMTGKPIGQFAVNGELRNILPDSIRRFNQIFNQHWLFGYYTAKLKLTYGSTAQVLASSIGFWVVPWELLLIVIAGLVVLFFILRFLIRKYNDSVIERSRRSAPPPRRSGGGRGRRY
jgi:hypothetical protein